MSPETKANTAAGLTDAADIVEKFAGLMPDGRLALGLLGAAEITRVIAALMKSSGLGLEQGLAQITPIDPIVLPWHEEHKP